MTLFRGQHETVSVPACQSLTVTAAANSSGSVVRLGDGAGAPRQSTTPVAAGQTVMLART